MSIPKLRIAPNTPDFDEALDYDEVAIDPDYDLADPDYDEGSQAEFADDFRDPDSEKASQEYQLRKQK